MKSLTSYWTTSPVARHCKNCKKDLPRKVRTTNTGFCRICRLKLCPPALGKDRPDMIGNKITPVKYGKDNYFGKNKFKGKDHALWKGNRVGYHALHSWLYRELGSPMTCSFCGQIKSNTRSIHWASKSRKYLRELDDWIRLCAKCHWHYDRDNKYD